MKVLTQPEWRRQSGRLFPVFFFWLALIAVTSTQIAPAGRELSWQEALRRSVLSWTVWALLAPLIIKVDQWLPVASDSLFKRFAFHVPFSLFFTALKQLLVGDVIPFFLKWESLQ